MAHSSPLPASKASALLKRLGQLALDGVEATELETRQIERDATALLRSDAKAAHSILGGLAAQQGDADRSRHHHRIAVGLAGSDSTAVWNYAVSLCLLHQHKEALNVLQKALEQSPTELPLLDHAIEQALEAAEFRTGLALCERRRAIPPHEAHVNEPILTDLVAAIDSGAFTEHGAQRALQLARDEQRKSGLRSAGLEICQTCIEAHSFGFALHVFATTEDAVDLYVRFVDRIVTQDDLMADPGVALQPSFIGTTEHVSRPAYPA